MTAPAHTKSKDFFAALKVDAAQIETRYSAQFRINWLYRCAVMGSLSAIIALAAFSIYILNIDFHRLFTGFTRLSFFVSVMMPPAYGSTHMLGLYLGALAETVAMAILGTLLAASFALPFGFMAARNVVAQRVVHFFSRRSLDMIRTVNILIWALIWINVVGLGPFAGVLALATADFGMLSKLFADAIETSDQKAALGVLSTGGNGLHRICFGLLPGVLPVLVGQVLYQIESNTRSATVLGVVGAGGIGSYLQEQIQINEWQHVAFLTIILLITVSIIDMVSSKIRHAVIGGKWGEKNMRHEQDSLRA